MCNVYSYMRISTSEERDLQKFTRQESALQRYARENDIEYLLEFREDKSGKNFTERKQWQKLESIVQPGDMIIFKDICRFTREAEQGYVKYMELLNKGVELIFIDNQTVASVYGGQHASAHVISRVFSVIFNRRTSLYASFIFLENP